MIIKPEQIIYECLLGFCFNNIFCAATNFWHHRRFSSLPNSETKKWWVIRFNTEFSTAAGLFWTVNVCWAHPVISRASAVAGNIFHGVIPDAFWSSQNRMCRKLNKPKQWVGNFILLIFINNVRCDESSLYFPVNPCPQPWRRLLCGSVRE